LDIIEVEVVRQRKGRAVVNKASFLSELKRPPSPFGKQQQDDLLALVIRKPND
jgi:hypothetical protein